MQLWRDWMEPGYGREVTKLFGEAHRVGARPENASAGFASALPRDLSSSAPLVVSGVIGILVRPIICMRLAIRFSMASSQLT